MNIAWYLGFGWVSIAAVLACGAGINTLPSPMNWVLYVPFLIVAVHMTVRFRLFNSQPWRRVHARAMLTYGQLAEQEYDAAKKENREFDISSPCRALSNHLFGEHNREEIASLLGDGRTRYYHELVECCPHIFLGGIAQDRREAVLDGIRKDIDVSHLGPDVLIAKTIEQKHGKPEAARYLQSLMLGRVR